MPFYSLYLFIWNFFCQIRDSHDECCQPKNPMFVHSCLFIQGILHRLSKKNKTPTGFSKAGKSLQVQSSSLQGLFVRFKKLSLRIVDGAPLLQTKNQSGGRVVLLCNDIDALCRPKQDPHGTCLSQAKLHQHRSLHNKYCIYVSLVANFPEKKSPKWWFQWQIRILERIKESHWRNPSFSFKRMYLLFGLSPFPVIVANEGSVQEPKRIVIILVVTITGKVQHPKVY